MDNWTVFLNELRWTDGSVLDPDLRLRPFAPPFLRSCFSPEQSMKTSIVPFTLLDVCIEAGPANRALRLQSNPRAFLYFFCICNHCLVVKTLKINLI